MKLSQKLRRSSGHTLTYENYIVSLNPIGYWPLNESTGNTAYDLSGNNYHGTISGTPIIYNGDPLRLGHPGAMGFSVTSQGLAKVSVGYSFGPITTLFSQGKSGTIMGWFKRTTNTTYNQILAFYTQSLNGLTNYRITGNATTPFTYSFQTKDNQNHLSLTNGVLNDVYFFAWIKDGTTLKLFFNNTWVSRENMTESVHTAGSNNGYPRGLEFPAVANWNYYGIRGYLSDIAMFARALTQQEVEYIYNTYKII